MKRQYLRDFAIALSVANLCFVGVWYRLFSLRRFLKPTYSSFDFLAIILNVLLLATLFWMVRAVGRHATQPQASLFFQWIPLLALVFPLNYLRANFTPISISSMILALGKLEFVALGLVTAALALYVVVRWHRRLLAVAETLALGLLIFVVVLFSQAAWGLIQLGSPVTRADKPPAGPLPAAKASAPRVLWLVFDEMDQRLTFAERPPTVQLPELDRLRGEAFYASNAYPPANKTLLSMPALITGRLISQSTPAGPNELMITFADTQKTVGWSTQPNLFSKARDAGFNTAVVGWYLPYCRVLGKSLTTCSWEPFEAPAGKGEPSLSKSMVSQLRSLLPWDARQNYLRQYLSVFEEAKKAATHPGLGLILVHVPVPHYPAIYDRHKGELTLFTPHRDWYLDNLALADRTLGELRRAMESAGTWENATILLSSDHALRPSAAYDGKTDPRVPFVLKLAGQQKAVAYEPAFNTVLTHDLLLALLDGELPDAASVAQWLDQRAELSAR